MPSVPEKLRRFSAVGGKRLRNPHGSGRDRVPLPVFFTARRFALELVDVALGSAQDGFRVIKAAPVLMAHLCANGDVHKPRPRVLYERRATLAIFHANRRALLVARVRVALLRGFGLDAAELVRKNSP